VTQDGQGIGRNIERIGGLTDFLPSVPRWQVARITDPEKRQRLAKGPPRADRDLGPDA
jgi:hypothetical protein